MKYRVGLFLLFLLLAAASTAYAAEGRIPIYEPVSLNGMTANIEGKYTVVRNITSANGLAIRIEGTGTERIEINLNGFTVGRNTTGPVILVLNVRSFVIENGSITGLAGGGGNVLRIEDTAMGGEVIVDGLKVSGGGTGIHLKNAPNFRVVNNLVVDTGTNGILALGDASREIGGLIENNQVLSVTQVGIWVGDTDATPVGLIVRGNRVEGAGNDGIRVKTARSFIVDSNIVADCGITGIKIQGGQSGRLIGNAVSGSGSAEGGGGIAVISGPPFPGDLLIADNVSSGNPGYGMSITGSGHRIQNNVVNANALWGIKLWGDDNTFGANTARNNAGTPTCATPPPGQCASPDFCDDGTNNSTFGTNFMPGGC